MLIKKACETSLTGRELLSVPEDELTRRLQIEQDEDVRLLENPEMFHAIVLLLCLC